MVIHLAWSDAELPDELGAGPWTATLRAGPGLLLVASEQGRSPVYHALKDVLPKGAALLVTTLDRAPKAKGLVPGAHAWLRRHGLT